MASDGNSGSRAKKMRRLQLLTAMPKSWRMVPSFPFRRMTVYVSLMRQKGWYPSGSRPQTNDPDSEDDADKLDIPIYGFDLIVAEECHRG
jgi:hypothetical protein